MEKEPNAHFKETVANILALKGCDTKILQIVRQWNFTSPQAEKLLELDLYGMDCLDDLKTCMVNCTTTTVEVGSGIDYNE